MSLSRSWGIAAVAILDKLLGIQGQEIEGIALGAECYSREVVWLEGVNLVAVGSREDQDLSSTRGLRP